MRNYAIKLPTVMGLILILPAAACAVTLQVGPGADLAGATSADTENQERLNVDRTDTVTLIAGTYDVLDFQLNVKTADTGDSDAGTITPMLVTGAPSTYTTLWIGNAFDPTTTGQQTAETYSGETFTLAAQGVVYAGIFTGNKGSAIAALTTSTGTTDHDANGFSAPTGVGQTVDGFSHAGLGRAYAIEINIDVDPADIVSPPVFVVVDGDSSSAVGTDLLQTHFGSVTDTGLGATGGGDPIGLEPVLRDGVATDTTGYEANDTTSTVVQNGESITYTLDTGANPAGYRIDQIDIFLGWRDDGRDAFGDVDVEYATVSDPGSFLPLLSNGNTGDFASSYGRASVVPGGGRTFLATNVESVRLTFNSIQNGYGGLSEIDIIGVAVPEPSTLALAAIGLGGLRRRRRRA